MTRLTPLALLLLTAQLATGCVSPYLRLHSSAEGLQQAPTLLVSATYGEASGGNQEKGLLKAAVKIASNLNLDEVGEHLVSVAVKTGEQFGFAVAPNKERAQSLDVVKGGAMDALAGAAQVMGGAWIYPEGSRNTFINDTTWLTDSYKRDLVKSLKGDKEGEHFLFVSARHTTDSEFLFFERAVVVLYILIINDSGKEIFEGRGIGYGATQFWNEDSSPAGLKDTIDRALVDMLAQTKETLE
ncbi:MAG: hypothetical protein FJ138_02120 [Deltaproteobacteria bacterium]|nr:hypothetical protein [Deltaproteobacteria bacterium]